MLGQFLQPILEWLGIGLVPFLIGILIIVNVMKG